MSAVAIAIFDKEGKRILFQLNNPFQKVLHEIELFLHCSLDILNDKVSKSNEMYIGLVYNDQNFKSYGYVTNSSVSFVLIMDAAQVAVKDQDIRALFKKIHTTYCIIISNPFYTIGSPITSRHLFENVMTMFPA